MVFARCFPTYCIIDVSCGGNSNTVFSRGISIGAVIGGGCGITGNGGGGNSGCAVIGGISVNNSCAIIFNSCCVIGVVCSTIGDSCAIIGGGCGITGKGCGGIGICCKFDVSSSLLLLSKSCSNAWSICALRIILGCGTPCITEG